MCVCTHVLMYACMCREMFVHTVFLLNCTDVYGTTNAYRKGLALNCKMLLPTSGDGVGTPFRTAYVLELCESYWLF